MFMASYDTPKIDAKQIFTEWSLDIFRLILNFQIRENGLLRYTKF